VPRAGRQPAGHGAGDGRLPADHGAGVRHGHGPQRQDQLHRGRARRPASGPGDLRAFENGARRLRNVFIQPTGGVTRRPGLRHVAMLPGVARLLAFEFNTEQTYLLVLSDRLCRSSWAMRWWRSWWRPGRRRCWTASPSRRAPTRCWWCHSGHAAAADYPQQPHRWSIDAWNFVGADHRFVPASVTLTPARPAAWRRWWRMRRCSRRGMSGRGCGSG
jgi:hypothetical protein